LFLDEIAELPLHMQVKLLRALQEKSIRPVGSPKEIPIDVRVLSATHRNLAELVEAGSFRQDLFYRINVIGLHVPPLRERISDIPLLAKHILKRLADFPDETTHQISDQAMVALITYPFPGNVRELENILERAITLCESNTITLNDLQLPQSRSAEEITSVEEAKPEGLQLENYLGTIEKEAIVKALEQTGYNKTAAAKLLGITFRAMRYRLKKLGLD
jgi:two-component system response regulator PilR (NtrC family)